MHTHLREVAELLRTAADILTHAMGEAQASPMRPTRPRDAFYIPTEADLRAAAQAVHKDRAAKRKAATVRHAQQRQFVAGWLASHGCQLVKHKVRYDTYSDPSGGQWELHAIRLMRIEAGLRTYDLDALLVYLLIVSELYPDLRPATLPVICAQYRRDVMGRLEKIGRR